jgi:selT/selW/selH-like putative selenoprotein
LKDKLQAKLEGIDYQIEGVRQSQRTGDFEVQVDGELVHSKKGGAGFPDDDEKLQKIVIAIKSKA